MKNNKKIITEVSRLQELMGVNKELINEQAKPIVAAVKSLKTLVQNASKKTSPIIRFSTKKEVTDVGIWQRKLLKRINILTDNTKVASQKVTALKYILANGDEKIVKLIDKLIKDQSENTIKLLNKTIDDNRPMIKNWIEDGLTKKQIIKLIMDDGGIIKTGDDAIDLIIKRNMRENIGKAYDEIKGPVANDQGTTIRKKITDKTDDTLPNKVTDDGGDVETIANIEKTFNEIADDISESEINLLNKKYSKTITKWFEKLKAIYGPYFKSVTKLQDDILKDIAMYNKIKPNLRPAFAKRIIAKQQKLGQKSSEFLQSTKIWIEKNIRPMATRSNPEMLDFYRKLEKGEGWKRIGILSQLYKGLKTGLTDLSTGNKELRNAWLKVMLKPASASINMISKVINKIFTKELKMIGRFTPTQKTAFWNWFLTTNPKGLPALKKAFKGTPIAGLSYVGIQALYRYFILSFSIGLGRSLGALAVDGIDQAAGTNLSDNRILSYFTGADNYENALSDLKASKGSENMMDYLNALNELLMVQSEPFRSFIGVWPAGVVANGMVDLGKSVLDDVLEQDIEDMVEEAENVKNNHPEIIPVIEDEQTTPEVTPVPNTVSGTIEDAAKQLGVDVEEVTQDGDIFIWSMDGEEIGRYKMINGKLKIQ